MQESRLFKIIYYLLDKGKVTAPELSKKFEVSIRTIYRDIDVISSAGIPIYAQTGRNGGIQLYDDFILDKVLLSNDEKQEILSAIYNFAIVGSGEEETLRKISALFNMQHDSCFEIDFSRWNEISLDNLRFNDLKSAIIQHKCVDIEYINSYNEKLKRRIQPLKLLYKSKAWYIKAYCEVRQSFRIFKLNRIMKYAISNDTFVPLSPPETKTPPQVYRELVLHFTKDVSYRVYDEFDSNQIQCLTDGSLQVKAHMPEDTWLLHFLLSFGTDVTIIHPFYLKEIVAQKAQAIYLKNKP